MRRFLFLRWSRKSLSLKLPDHHNFTRWKYFLPCVRSTHPAYSRAQWKPQWVSSGTKAKQARLYSVLCLSHKSQNSASLCRLDVDIWNYSLILKKLIICLAISILKYEVIICERRAGEQELPCSVVVWLQLSFKLLSPKQAEGKNADSSLNVFLFAAVWCLRQGDVPNIGKSPVKQKINPKHPPLSSTKNLQTNKQKPQLTKQTKTHAQKKVSKQNSE